MRVQRAWPALHILDGSIAALFDDLRCIAEIVFNSEPNMGQTGIYNSLVKMNCAVILFTTIVLVPIGARMYPNSGCKA